MYISDCWAYEAVSCKIRLHGGVVYMTLGKGDIEICISLSPSQAIECGNFLAGAAKNVIPSTSYYGSDISMSLDDEQSKEIVAEDKLVVEKTDGMSNEDVKTVNFVSFVPPLNESKKEMESA